MKQATVNNELTLTYPDTYQEMSEEELLRYYRTAENRWGVYDQERHVILSVSWKKAGILSFFTDAESMMIGVEAQLKRSLINYRRKDAFKTRIAKQKGFGIRFEYRTNGANIYQIGDIRSIKHKGKFYSLQYIGRRITDEECHPDFDRMVESVKFG